MKTLFVLSLVLFSKFGWANPADSLTHTHIGSACTSGTYSFAAGQHSLSGAGADVYSSSDEMDYAWAKLSGNYQITARVTSAEFIHNWTKAGVMLRQSLIPFSKYAYTLFAPQGLLTFQDRVLENGVCEDCRFTGVSLPYWVKIIRKGDTVVSQISTNGTLWRTLGLVSISLEDTIYLGLAVTSHLACTPAIATFDSVTMTKFTASLTSEMRNSTIQSRLMYSANVVDTFKIFTALPINYDSLRAEAYPVVYYLDGNNTGFHLVLRELMAAKAIPDVISVSIGYPGATQRTRDYTSGFANFYSFLKTELIPSVDRRYHTDTNNRTLFGHSFGGICCLLTLFEDSNYKDFPFQNIIPSSPSIWWPDGQQTYTLEQNLFNTTQILPLNVYMTMGSEEVDIMVSDFYRLSDVLTSRNYQYFNFKYVLNEGQTHGSNINISFREGTTWILNQPLPSVITVNTCSTMAGATAVFPNPASSYVTIRTNNSETSGTAFSLINTSGQTVYRTSTNNSTMTINISTLPRGLYLLKSTSGNKQWQQKIMVIPAQ